MSDDKQDKLLHYGVKRRSGRYPWGSGETESFMGRYEKIKEENPKWTDTDIAKEMGLNSTQLRTKITWANKERKAYLQTEIVAKHEEGMSKTAISKELGVSEATVRNYLSQRDKSHKTMQLENVNKAMIKGVENTGYLDVGVGVEGQLGVPRTRFNAVVNKMVNEDGYYVHEIYVPRLNDPSKKTIIKVLTKEPDLMKVVMDQDKIRPLDSWSDDRGETIQNINPPKSVDPSRVKIRYKEEGGVLKDGVIELRPGVEELDMGASHYAQVRIKVGEDRFLKGMAVNGDAKDFPKGVDIIFNTNKPLGTDKMDVLKKTKDEGDNIFGSTITRQNKSNVLNIVNEEGEWDTWSTSLASQFLSKQPVTLIKDRLDATHKGLREELDEIKSITNPVVKQHLIDTYANSLNSKAARLAAKGIKDTKSHVILPFPDMNPDEIYAPNYQNGDRVVLLRYPHGGTFELPQVTVNNNYAKARKVLGIAPDAIGIHPSVAEKLSGADFDGDTAYVIPNNRKGPLAIKTTRTLKELKNFDPMDYKVDHKTISKQGKENMMGIVSNLITDMTIKGASEQEIARAVRHSMVVIDSEKHNLDYKRSARENNISALKKQYQSHINPETGKKSVGASTLISRSKKLSDRMAKEGIDILDPSFKIEKYSSGTPQEKLYVGYVKQLQSLKNEAKKTSATIKMPIYNKDAAVAYKEEVSSLNAKLDKARLNAPKERQAQILSNKIYYANVTPDLDKDQKKKLKNRSLARARATTGAKGKETSIELTQKEWDAIESRAVSATKIKEVLRYADIEQVRKYATPRDNSLPQTKVAKAQQLLKDGYTYDQVARSLGVNPASLRTAKLTSAKAQRVQSMSNSGMSVKEIAKKLGVSESAVSNALN